MCVCVCELVCVISEGKEVWPGGGRVVYCVFFSCSSSNIRQ